MKRLIYLVLAVSSSVQACEIGNASYELLGNNNFTASFKRLSTGNKTNELLLNVLSSESKQSYWFRFNVGNGYSTVSLTPVEQPKEGQPKVIDLNKPQVLHQPIYFIKEDLSFYAAELSNPLEAPTYIFASNLGEVLWYIAPSLGAAEGVRENMPRAFFKLKRCR